MMPFQGFFRGGGGGAMPPPLGSGLLPPWKSMLRELVSKWPKKNAANTTGFENN